MALTESEKAELASLRAKSDSASSELTMGGRLGATAYGATTGFLGGIGELEKLGKEASYYIVPKQPGEEKPPLLTGGRETFFPTEKEIQAGLSKIGVKPPAEQYKGYQTAGEIIGGIGPSIPSIARGLTRSVIGLGTKVSEKLAQEAEKLGFKLSPAQVRRAEPVSQKGAAGFAEHNQDLANKLVSRTTGEEAKLVDKNFIAERLESLGKDFDKVYKGKSFQIDRDAINAIQTIASEEAALPGIAGVSPVRQVANEILAANRDLMSVPGANKFSITGEGLQRLRNALTQRARSTNRADAHEIYNLVDEIDNSIARNHPEVAKQLNEIRPKYRSSIILEDLYRGNGIRGGDVDLEKLGTMLGSQRSAVRSPGIEIDKLGQLGRELKIAPIFRKAGESAEAEQKLLSSLLGTGYDVLATPLRTRPARVLQRYTARTPETALTAPLRATAAGAAAKQLTQDEE